MDAWTPKDLEKKLQAEESIFLKLWKPGCGACKLSKPAIERIEQGVGSELIFGEIDADAYPEMYEISGTEVLPAFFVFKKGKKTGAFVGFKGLKKLEDMVSEALS